MKFILMYAILAYLISCADARTPDCSNSRKAIRAILWPYTLNLWFRKQTQQLHFFLTILWCALISGWLLSLLSDRL